jgi:transcriptional regulator with XRE-family HTH domain
MSVQSLQRDSTLYYVSRVAAERTKQLIERVKTWCIAHEVKQRELADKLGVFRKLLTKWLRSEKSRRVSAYADIAGIAEIHGEAKSQSEKAEVLKHFKCWLFIRHAPDLV